ncbi:C6 zinc finger domain-containing protein [Ilyonectria destructans]|nr:C6 zinc finger domain-containing protein [Ilyonectria destructans]
MSVRSESVHCHSTMRRSHKKSRNGCKDCKRRKVKCDEVYPSCFHCSRQNLRCSLSDREQESRHVTSVSAGSRGPATPNLPATPLDDSIPLYDEHIPLEIPASPSSSSNMRELELMHHYSINTSNSLALREDLRYVWRVIVPQEGYDRPFVLHGILAVAAVHKAQLVPSSRQTYLNLGTYYQSVGLEAFRTIMQNVDKDSWKPFFLFASSVILYACLLPARSESRRLERPISSIMELFAFIRGIKSIGPYLGGISRGNLSPLNLQDWVASMDESFDGNLSLAHSCLPGSVFDALCRLKHFIRSDATPEDRDDYLTAVDELEKVARLLAHAGVHPECCMVLFWPYVISDKVIAQIKAFDRLALLLMSYYSVFLSIMGSHFWFLQGWGPQLLTEIEHHLINDQDLMELLRWPREQVFSSFVL